MSVFTKISDEYAWWRYKSYLKRLIKQGLLVTEEDIAKYKKRFMGIRNYERLCKKAGLDKPVLMELEDRTIQFDL